MKKYLTLGAAIAAVLASGAASAGVTGNIGAASNYIWRGYTQSNDQAAISGGLDYSNDSGFYAGTWASNVDFSGGAGAGEYELDLYAGFGGEAGGLGYDLGVATYQYPINPNTSFTELYVSGTFSVVTVGVNYTVDAGAANDAEKTAGALGVFDKGDLYVHASADFDTAAGAVSVYAGSYMFDNSNKSYANGNTYTDLDYNHYGVSLSKDDFTFAIDKNDSDAGTEGNARVSVSWSKEFELM
jgi:uncharacterized protein (TIGR02001 family)